MNDITTPIVRSVFVLDEEGQRIYAQYWDGPLVKDFSAQRHFENQIHMKSMKTSARMDSEALLFEGNVILYKFCSDSFFYIVASEKENELILSSVLAAIQDAIQILLRSPIDKRLLIEQLDMLVLVVDEAIDDGMILEIDPESIASRVLMRGTDGEGSMASGPLTEQTLKQAMTTARDQFFKSFR